MPFTVRGLYTLLDVMLHSTVADDQASLSQLGLLIYTCMHVYIIIKRPNFKES